MILCGLCALCGSFFFVVIAALTPEILRSSGAVPAYVAGQFREAAGFQQSASGQYFVFDRRAHAVYGLDPQQSSAWEIVKIGGESGRIIDPTAFAVEPNGTFVVADAPNNRERIQIFTPAGVRIGGFLLPGRLKTRVAIGNALLNGIGSLQYTGTSILMSQPETGALIAEYELNGGVHRTIGRLRRTGHEEDPELHLVLNSGIPLVDPAGGFFFVFQTASRCSGSTTPRDSSCSSGTSGARDRRAGGGPANEMADTADERGGAAAGDADDPHRRGRSRRQSLARVQRAVHVRLR